MHNYLPSSPSLIQPIPPEMDSTASAVAVSNHPLHEESVAALWDWSDLLDFTLDDQLTFPVDPELHPPPAPAIPPMVPEITPDSTVQESPPQPPADNSPGRIRKRDPRLTCSNFLAGRVPCACPEIDEKLEEEAGGLPGKKRARTVRVLSAGSARCQVPGCEADISELKGYHKRHRVCLRCANASSVVLDGQSKRYCQQCGKFHILSDFDEGKRSCRRKLERHNNRRRRKPSDSKGHAEKDPQQILLSEDIGCDEETGEDSTSLSGQLLKRDMLLESEGYNPNLSSAAVSQTVRNDSSAYGETKIDSDKDNSNNTPSPSYSDDKVLFSSVCPTGRISFKLYDWNPAEFPRRLRHQIFQWLASMPVELEGYIRPGCTILTVFIAMPKFMWDKLHEDPNKHVQDFIVAPGSLLFGRGTFFVYLNHFIFHVRDGISVTKLEMREEAPKLHYVHPPCFEAGKPMEFVACGSNLLRPNFRFLISFSGKYLAYNFCVKLLNPKPEGDTTCDHQMLKINVPCTEADVFGPAFIEVENECGLSNFIPVLIGDKKVCSEMKIMQQSFDRSCFMKGSLHGASNSLCEVSKLRQTEFSEFLLDIAWLLKKPAVENVQPLLTSSQIQRLNRLLSFLIKHESIAILERALCYMKILKDNRPPTCIAGLDIKQFESNLRRAADVVDQRLHRRENLVMHPRNCVPKGEGFDRSSNSDMLSIPVSSQDAERREEDKLDATAGSTPADENGTFPLLNGEVFTSINFGREQPRKPGNRLFKSRVLTSRPLVLVIAAAAGCCGICAVLLHPQKVSELAVTIRRCLFDDT